MLVCQLLGYHCIKERATCMILVAEEMGKTHCGSGNVLLLLARSTMTISSFALP